MINKCLDDVLMEGETWGQLQRRLRLVLENWKIRNAGLALSHRKCQFGMTTVECLVAVIDNGMISMSEARVQHLRTSSMRSGAERWSEQVTINIQWLNSVAVTGGAGVTRSEKLLAEVTEV